MRRPVRILGIVALLLVAGLVLPPPLEGDSNVAFVPWSGAVAGGDDDCATVNPQGTPVTVNPDECL